MKTWLTLLLLTLLSFPLAANAADDDRIKALEQRIEQLEQQLDLSAEKPRVEEEATQEGIKFGGALRVNYNYQDWQENDKDRYGEFDFDTFRLNLDGEIKDIIFSAEYRFYPQDDWNAPHHAWFGYNINDDMQAQLGIQQVPFGLQPYASHNFWFSGAYYVGLEDDYDLGVKFLYTPGPLSVTPAVIPSTSSTTPTVVMPAPRPQGTKNRTSSTVASPTPWTMAISAAPNLAYPVSGANSTTAIQKTMATTGPAPCT